MLGKKIKIKSTYLKEKCSDLQRAWLNMKNTGNKTLCSLSDNAFRLGILIISKGKLSMN